MQKKIKVIGWFGGWKKIDKGVMQGSILGPFLLNYHTLMIFSCLYQKYKYAAMQMTLFSLRTTNVITKLENGTSAVTGWTTV